MSEGFQKKQKDAVLITRLKWLIPTGKSVVDAKQMQVWMDDGSTYVLDNDYVQEHFDQFKIYTPPQSLNP